MKTGDMRIAVSTLDKLALKPDERGFYDWRELLDAESYARLEAQIGDLVEARLRVTDPASPAAPARGSTAHSPRRAPAPRKA